MISVCTVTLNRLQPFLDIFCESVVKYTKYVDEVIIVNAEMDSSIDCVWSVGNIVFKLFGGKHDLFKICDATSYCAQHAFGLHQAIERTKNSILILSDPDIFFYTYIDEFYLELVEKYNLDFIGISHPNAISAAMSFFPSIINSMVNKDKLPPDDYPPEHNINCEVKSKYLFPGTVRRSAFPRPEGHYETGCNLLLWALDQNWRWLSFQTADCHNYTTNYYRSSFKMGRLERQKILYHASLAAGPHNRIVEFTKAYHA